MSLCLASSIFAIEAGGLILTEQAAQTCSAAPLFEFAVGLVTKRVQLILKSLWEHKEKANGVDDPHTCGNLYRARNQRLPTGRVLILRFRFG